MKRILALGAVAALAAAVPAQKDPVDRSFRRWFRDFKAGKIDPGEQVPKKKDLYVHKSLYGEIPLKRRFTRLDEAEFLFFKLKERADAPTAKKFLDIVAASLKKKGGKLWEPAGKLSMVRECLLETLVEGGCPPEFQEAVVARIEKGLTEVAGAAGAAGDGKGEEKVAGTFEHSEPEMAAALIPLLGAFNQPKHRDLLIKLLRVKESGIVTMAAEAFAIMGYGPAVAPVARVLHGQEFRDEIGWLSHSLQRLIPCESPKPEEKDLRYSINLVLDLFEKLTDWRSRLSLVPITRMIRSRATVPVLISLLEQAKKAAGKAAKDAYSGTLLNAANQSLVDLTGFYADYEKPEEWRAWWNANKANFKLAEAKKKIVIDSGDSFVKGFFGIPVTGSRVVFIVDISGSMVWPMRSANYVAGQTGHGAKGSYESRMDRAKKELGKAINSMGGDSKFNVVFFAGHVKVWKKKLVTASKKGKAAFAKELARVNAGGGTAVYDGLAAALGLSADPRAKVKHPFAHDVDEVFVLTDGAPTMGEIQQPRRILKVVERWNRRAQVRIHAVYLGDEKVDKDFERPGMGKPPEEWLKPEVFMRRLAEQNQGSFQEPAKG